MLISAGTGGPARPSWPSSANQACAAAVAVTSSPDWLSTTSPGASAAAGLAAAAGRSSPARRPSARCGASRRTSRCSAPEKTRPASRCRHISPQQVSPVRSTARSSSPRPRGWNTSRKRALASRSRPVAPARVRTPPGSWASSVHWLTSPPRNSLSTKYGIVRSGRPSLNAWVNSSVAGSLVAHHSASTGSTRRSRASTSALSRSGGWPWWHTATMDAVTSCTAAPLAMGPPLRRPLLELCHVF